MTSIELNVTGAKATAQVSGLLTGGMTGILVDIAWDSAWDGLIKTLVCRCGIHPSHTEILRTMVGVEDQATVAHEVMIPGRHLYLGLEGRNADGTLVYPTVWADCGEIKPGANALGEPAAEATPSAWQQLLLRIGSLNDLYTETKENLVAAINELYEMSDVQFAQLTAVMADKAQLMPAFAASIDQCTDTEKLYVLPDGYVYAYSDSNGWESTGHAFVPADYEDRILALEKALLGDLDIYGIVDENNNILMTGSLLSGTYTLKYQNADGTTSQLGTFEIA